MAKQTNPARTLALGGVLAALAVTVMVMGTIIPVATYVCPVICIFLLQFVLKICGCRLAWSWYGAVAILSVLLAPDKEAAVLFGFLGYYPILKPWLDKRAGKWLWKGAFFNASALIAYFLMLHLFGIEQVVEDLSGTGTVMTILLLVLGNVTFFLLDRLLQTGLRRMPKR